MIEGVAFALGVVAAFAANDDAIVHCRTRTRWQTLSTVLLAMSLLCFSSSGIVMLMMGARR